MNPGIMAVALTSMLLVSQGDLTLISGNEQGNGCYGGPGQEGITRTGSPKAIAQFIHVSGGGASEVGNGISGGGTVEPLAQIFARGGSGEHFTTL